MGILTELGGGQPSFKFNTVGDTVSGTIVSADIVQKTNFTTRELEYWSDGKPVQQIKLVLDTDLRDPDIEADDGKRAVYVKAWGDQLKAFRAAIEKTGDKDVKVGGKLSVRYTGNAVAKSGQPPKVYAYLYDKPAVIGQVADDPWATPPAAAPMPPLAPEPAPAVDPAAAAAFANLSPEQLAAFQAMASGK